MKWRDIVAAMPPLSKAQAEAVKAIIDRHTSDLVSDHPPVDDAMFHINRDIDSLIRDQP